VAWKGEVDMVKSHVMAKRTSSERMVVHLDGGM